MLLSCAPRKASLQSVVEERETEIKNTAKASSDVWVAASAAKPHCGIRVSCCC